MYGGMPVGAPVVSPAMYIEGTTSPPLPMPPGVQPSSVEHLANANQGAGYGHAGEVPPTVAAAYQSRDLEKRSLSGDAAAGDAGDASEWNEEAHYRSILNSQPVPITWCAVNYYEFEIKVVRLASCREYRSPIIGR